MDAGQLGTVEEIFDRIMTRRDWEKKDLAEFLDLDPSTLSQKLGAHWNKHFQVFMRLLPLMVEAGMIDCKQLCGASDKSGGNSGAGGSANSVKAKRFLAKNALQARYIMSTLSAPAVWISQEMHVISRLFLLMPQFNN